MDEQQPDPMGFADDVPVHPTGLSSVDDVVEEVARLADLPVSQHVAVFERAHDRLRRALDAQPDA